MPNSETLVQYFNIGIISLIVLFAFIGYIRGTYKSVFYLIATAIIFLVGWFLMNPVIKMMMNYDVSSYNIVLGEIPLHNINKFIPDYIVKLYPQAEQLITEDTMVKELVVSLTTMVIKVLYCIVLVILAFSAFKLLTDIFWMLFKPKKKKGSKKTIGSRLGGLGIGTFKGAFYVLLICFPLAGIASIAQSIAKVAPSQESENLQYNLVFVEDKATLVQTNTSENNTTSQTDEILNLLGIYSKTAAGKVFETVKVDEFIFDSVFSFKLNNSDIKLRNELQKIATAFSKSDGIMNGEFSIKKLMDQDPDLLKDIINDISDLEIVKVAIPMGVEVALYLKDKAGNPVVKLPDDFDFNMEEVKNSDFSSDVKKLGYAFVDISTLYNQKGKTDNLIDYLSFDPEVVKSIMGSISDTVSIKYAPIVISYVTTIDTIEASLNKIGLSAEDLGLNDIDSWSKEFKQFGEIYEAVANLKLKSITDQETFEFVTEENVGLLSKSIFESELLANATPFLVKTLSDGLMPDEYKDLIVVDNDIWNENEFNAVINAAVSLKKSGVMDSQGDVFAKLTDATINDLAKYLSKSKFITSNLNTITESFTKDLDFFANTKLVTLDSSEWTELEIKSLFKSISMISSSGAENLINLEDDKIIELSGHISRSKFITNNFDTILDKVLVDIDLGEDVKFGTYDNWEDVEASELELFNLFKSAKIIKSKGSDINAFTSLNDSELDIFLKSEYISETLVNVLKSLSQEGKKLDLLIGVDNPDVKWYDNNVTKTTFTIEDNVMNIVVVDGANKYNIYADGIKVASTSNLKYTFETIDPEAVYTVEGFEEGELRRMFRAMGSITDNLTADGGFTTDMITNLTDEEINNIVVSDILVLSLVKKFEDMKVEDPNSFVVIPEGPLASENDVDKLDAWKNKLDDKNHQTEGELSKSLKGLRILLAGVDVKNFEISSITALTEEQIKDILKSDVLSESIIVQIEKLDDDPQSVIAVPINLREAKNRDDWKNDYIYDVDGNLVPSKFGELHKSLRALKIIVKDGNIENIDVNNILDEANKQIVLDSQIVEETIINKVILTANEPGSIIKIPEYIASAPDRSVWKQTENGEGELRKLLTAFDYLMGENGSINQFNFDIGIVIADQNEILKSDIIVETIIYKLNDQTGINIPTGLEYGLNDPNDRSEWKNQYALDENNNYVYQDGNIVVIKPGELSRLLNAVDLIIEPDAVTGKKSLESINFDIEVAFDDTNQDILLYSYIISETIVNKILEESKKDTLKIPSQFYLNGLNDLDEENRDKWFNTYVESNVETKGEIAHLLDAVEILLDGNTFSGVDFDISKVIESQDIILKSKIISETIVHKVFTESSNDVLKIPNDAYVNPIDDQSLQSRDKWFNTYIDGIVNKKGEIAHLLDAVEILLDGNTFSGVDFDISKVIESQDIILKSKIISETIVHKVFTESSNDVLKIPSDTYINPIDDQGLQNRDKWFNTYVDSNVETKGEIAHLLDAVEILLDGNTFSGMTFNINKAFDKVSQQTILKSKVISESLINKIISQKTVIPEETFPDRDLNGKELDNPTDRSAWFNEYIGEYLITENELAKFLDAINIVVGTGTFESMESALSIDNILALEQIEVVMDGNKIVTSSSFEIVLNSIIIENIIAPLLYNVATITMADFLEVPDDGYHFNKLELVSNPELTYDSKSFLDSLFLMNKAGFDYNNLGMEILTINNGELANAMVASRVFKGSIAKMFNHFIKTLYDNTLPPMLFDPLRYKRDWVDVEIKQTVYDETQTPLEAHTILVNDLVEHKIIDYYYE